MKIRFDVNDGDNRSEFLVDVLPRALKALSPDRIALWGGMSAQQMVEHLLWTFDVSNGTIESPCPIPEEKRPRYRAFLLDNRPTPHHFESPVLKEGLPPQRFAAFDDAIEELVRQVRAFERQSADQAAVQRMHPLFGPLDAEGWSRNHFKHGVHHLLQFGLIEVEEVPGDAHA